jgi:hypothetical protein
LEPQVKEPKPVTVKVEDGWIIYTVAELFDFSVTAGAIVPPQLTNSRVTRNIPIKTELDFLSILMPPFRFTANLTQLCMVCQQSHIVV